MAELFSFKNKKFTWRGVVFLVGLVVLFMILQAIYKKPGFDNSMVLAANEINKNCPMMIDSITRLDNSAALTNKIFQFNYTILNADKSDYDTSALINTVKPRTINLLKTDSRYKLYRDKNITLSYTYHDKIGSYLSNISMTPKEYK